MKPNKPRYHTEELVLVFIFLFFFIGIFIGSFKFRPEARFFPLVLSTPGLVLVVLYLIRRFLPETINIIIEGEREFAIGAGDKKEIGSQIEHTKAAENQKESNDQSDVSPQVKSYLIILFSVLYIVMSYLVGFYISTVAALAAYFYFSRRRTGNFILGNVLLCILLLGIVYIFDVAFGHHFGLGVLTE